jgi:hypothetical protein
VATFDFTTGYTNGTTIEEVDSKWAGDTSNLIVTTSGGNALINDNPNGANRLVVYENSHGDFQSSRLVRAAGTLGSQGFVVVVNSSTSTGTGFRAIVYSTYVELRDNTTYVTDASHGVTLTSTALDIEIRSTDAGGGNATVAVYVQGSGSPIISSTRTAKTGGSPGFQLNDESATVTERITSWTDGVSATSIVPQAMTNYRMRAA